MSDVKLAKEAGFCFGVKRAVDAAIKIQHEYCKKIYTLGPLIHNNDVVSYLQDNNIYSVRLDEISNLSEGDIIVIRSHGVPKETLNLLEEKGLIVKNATCPYVSNIQRKVQKYYNDGYQIIILGDKNHPEVIGINGWCNNTAIITRGDELPDISCHKVCVVSQTTEKKENWNKLLEKLSKYNLNIEKFNTICAATEVRQNSAEELSKRVDYMIVIGGKHSSNTTKLYQISSNNCETIHIENASELSNDFLDKCKNKKIGITAGASTPDWIIREVISIMEQNSSNQEQLELMAEYDKQFKAGDVVKGEILSKTIEGVVISLVGYKADGIIPLDKLTLQGDPKEFADSLNIGDTLQAKIISRKVNEDGYVVLSRTVFEKDKVYEELQKLFDEETVFEVKISEVKEKGLVAYYKGARIFIPQSQIDIKYVENKEALKDTTMEVKLIEFVKGQNSKIIASRRVILEKDAAEKEAKAWESFNVGDVVKAEVKRFTSFGAFAEVNGVDGLIHLSQISWKHVAKAEDVLKKGDIIDVKIIDLDKEAKKLSLSIKQLTPEPWENVTEKYPVDSVVLGTVVRINDFGAFVELEPGLDGLVHISKISEDRIENPAQVLSIGEEVEARILSVDEEKKRISLSIKDV